MPDGLYRATIAGLGAAAGERLLTNGDLEQIVDTSDEWIVSRTGIHRRHVAAPETATSDLALRAGLEALAQAGLPGRDLDLVIVATVTPDMPFPSVSCMLQHKLGATRAAALDVAAGCSGFIYALAVAERFIATGAAQNALVIGAECLSRITDYQDRKTCVLFGDGAGAAVLRRARDDAGILSTYLGADGGGGDLLMQPAGGSRLPASHETVDRRLHYLHMNGPEVFKFAVRIIGHAAEEALRRAGLSRDEAYFLIPHQANERIVQAATKMLGLPEERVVLNIGEYGNMSSASIPVALHEAAREGRLKKGEVLVLVAFGAGLTWASCALRWGKLGPEPQEGGN